MAGPDQRPRVAPGRGSSGAARGPQAVTAAACVLRISRREAQQLVAAYLAGGAAGLQYIQSGAGALGGYGK